MRASRGSYELMKNAFIRMRQISSGFVNVKNEETGKVERLELKESPKLEWIKSQLPDMDGQAIVFHDFIYSGEMLQRELNKLGVSNCLINGKVSKTA